MRNTNDSFTVMGHTIPRRIARIASGEFGECPKCHKTVLLLAADTIEFHSAPGGEHNCPGSGLEPKPTTPKVKKES